jgi:hypothetical protein
MNAINGRYSGRSLEVDTARAPAGPSAVDRALRKNSGVMAKNYDSDALAIAKVLVRHYGDEAEAVLKRVGPFLDEARKGKR